ncbi:MAG: gliding motility lipoprotein GldD [Paludibacteraceae bacterium]|nr:gliding motility lipoprotein GldD [Paludibacteraceae bacterium]
MKHSYILLFLPFLLWSCAKPAAPKPYGYVRFTMPDTCYTPFSLHRPDNQDYPYNFLLSGNAVVQSRTQKGEHYWINIFYPSLNATVHCSYKPVRGNLRELTNDAIEFVYKNASHATSIPEQAYSHPEERVYGVFFDLEGNTASPYQFFLTDSTTHFFRASVYCNCRPNADSLAPIHQYLRQDMIHLIESFQWQY